MVCLCWYGNKHISPHGVKECEVCEKELKILKDTPDLCEWDDYSMYDQTKDPEHMQYLERQKVSLSACATDRYSCIPCGKHNLSKDYYEAHLTGKAHKFKMQEEKKGNKKQKIVEVEKGKKRKADDAEKKESLTFDIFFKFLGNRRKNLNQPQNRRGLMLMQRIQLLSQKKKKF